MTELTVNIFIESYRQTQCISSNAHLNWLKENINPVLLSIDPDLAINWACQNCAKTYMNMLMGWKDRKEKEESKPKNTPKKKRKPRKTVARTLKVKNK